MARARIAACALLLLCPLALSRLDDDFAFDSSDEFQVELTANHSEIAKNGLRRLWGVPDTSANVGHLFRMEIPKEAFSGKVQTYKVRTENGRRTPSWLAVDSRHGLISGIPLAGDVGPHTFVVTAHGRTHGLTATDSFTIEVKKADEKPFSKYGSCKTGEKRLVLTILLDGAFHQMAPRQRIRALMELSHFMALEGDEFWMEPYKAENAMAHTAVMSGPGSTQRKRGDATTAIYLNVGCGDKLWPRHKVLVAGVREQARDGTLAHTLRLPVLGWRLLAVKPLPRAKRQSQLDEGSGVYDAYDAEDDADEYSGYEDEDDEEEYGRVGLDDPEFDHDPVDPPQPTPPHPHRHHHGDSAPHTTTDVFQTETTTTSTTSTTPTTEPTSTTLAPTTTTPPPTTSTTSTPPPPTSTTSTPPPTAPPAPVATTPPDPPTIPTLPATDAPPSEEPREETTPEPASTNTVTTEDMKVRITPYSESASEASNMNLTHVASPGTPRFIAGRKPILDVDQDLEHDLDQTFEPDTQTVIIQASNEIPLSSPPPASASPPPARPPPPALTPAPSPPPTEPVATPAPTTTARPSAPPPPASPPPPPASPPPVDTVPDVTVMVTSTPPPETTIEEVTQQESASTDRPSTIIGQTTETVTFAMPVNQPPTLKHHMKKLAITAGKAFRYLIPADLFTDPEDGSNLTFTMYEADHVPLSNTSWIQFIPADREVYGLPLDAHVSRWNYIVEARDSAGLSARGPLDVTVQQHKGGRTVNHQFLMQLRLNHQYPNSIGWQIRVLEGIVNLFRDTDMDKITVLNATQTGDMCEFVWTNDTLPKDAACPMDQINRLMKIMESESSSGTPSAALTRAMSPELQVVGVSWRGVGQCAHAPPAPRPPARPAATRAPDTYPPVPRNQVDLITATVGHLLVYKVPEDTFFDPEDGGTRALTLSLRYSDRSEIPRGHWLQFDHNNQEFYGLPGPGDEGAVHYQLIAEDSSKKSAYDSLVVEVVKAPTIRPTVEFQMTMEYPFPLLAYNANNKRKVVEKLAALFGQTETDNIRIYSITDSPTTIIWYNTSLPMDRCPRAEIEELRRMIIAEEREAGGALRENVDTVFDKDFKVMSIRLLPLGLCAEHGTKTSNRPPPIGMAPPPAVAGPKGATSAESGYSEYLVTFIIPAVVIVCMILVAGVIACVLYRRRRTGKMSVGDEEERQAFRSKGIPVIFQDELEERGDSEPVHKSPVIMREEKPPLLPPAPDYRSSGEDAPYRPPPPFAASRTPPRPKATPTYRKPPPYVPP